jgi:uncharacterized protein YegJ (DUF2314 family)
MRAVVLTAFIALVSQVAFAQPAPVRTDDPEMTSAKLAAQKTFDSFLQAKAAAEAGTSSFAVKVALTDGRQTEHVWVYPFRPAIGGFEGVLKSQPMFMTDAKYGRQISFSRQQVSDWGYAKKGKRIGYRTVCVLLKRDPKLAAEEKKAGNEYECAP